MTDPTPVLIRPALPGDLAAVLGLEETCLGADAWSEGLIAQGLEGSLPTVLYLAAEADGVVVGHAVASIVADLAELQRIAVSPTYRRRGVAVALLAAVVERARSGDADRVLLEVREDNEGAQGFYAAQGFTELDRRARYYQDGSTAIVLIRTL